LSYYHAPLAAHSEVLGQLFLRSSWDDDARWAGFFGGTLEAFVDGKSRPIDLTSPKQLDFDHALVVVTGNARSVTIERPAASVFLLGLKPQRSYRVGPEMPPLRADPGGIIELTFRDAGFSGTIPLLLQR
jgi:hypothetical protein